MSMRDTPWPAGAPHRFDLVVPDVCAAREFSRAATNWTFADISAEFGHFQMCRVGDRNPAGIGATTTAAYPVGWTGYFVSEDIEATGGAVIESGGRLVLEPIGIGDACRVAMATDCLGARLGVFEAGGSVGLEVVGEPGALVWQSGSFHDIAGPAGSTALSSATDSPRYRRSIRASTVASRSVAKSSAASAARPALPREFRSAGPP